MSVHCLGMLAVREMLPCSEFIAALKCRPCQVSEAVWMVTSEHGGGSIVPEQDRLSFASLHYVEIAKVDQQSQAPVDIIFPQTAWKKLASDAQTSMPLWTSSGPSAFFQPNLEKDWCKHCGKQTCLRPYSHRTDEVDITLGGFRGDMIWGDQGGVKILGLSEVWMPKHNIFNHSIRLGWEPGQYTWGFENARKAGVT